MIQCGHCQRPYLAACWQGEMDYPDGSSRICPHWNQRLDEYGGMTAKDADEQAQFDARCG